MLPLRRWPGRRRQRGAALLMLILLVGLGAATLITTSLNRQGADTQRTQQSLQALSQAREALIGYAVQHGRLPRPASVLSQGREIAACDSEASCTGLLPWATLGVGGADGWNKWLRYSVSPVMVQSPINILTVVGTKTVIGVSPQGERYYLAGFPTCNLRQQCAAAVLISSGKHNLGVSVDGVRQQNGAVGNIDEITNDSSNNGFVSRAASPPLIAGAGGEFDDLVTWITMPAVLKPMSTAGVLK